MKKKGKRKFDKKQVELSEDSENETEDIQDDVQIQIDQGDKYRSRNDSISDEDDEFDYNNEKTYIDYDGNEINEEEDFDDVNDADESVEEFDKFLPTSLQSRRNLADMILEKLADSKLPQITPINTKEQEKIRKMYIEVGELLQHHTQGNLPKAITSLPVLENWETLIFLTKPERWSVHAMASITKLFSSSSSYTAEIFFNSILLPRIQDAFEKEKQKLSYHLYLALRYALKKSAPFYKGFLLPFICDGCTLKQAHIISSVLKRSPLNSLHGAVVIETLTRQNEESSKKYNASTIVFLKTLIEKRFSLPNPNIESIICYFEGWNQFYTSTKTKKNKNTKSTPKTKTPQDIDLTRLFSPLFKNKKFKQLNFAIPTQAPIEIPETAPVLSHQTLLSFVQHYSLSLTNEQKNRLNNVTKNHFHELVSPRIREFITNK